jgi:hypothetical protein
LRHRVRPGLVYGNGGSYDIPKLIELARKQGIAPHLGSGGQHGNLRLADPGRLELGAERHDQQHRQAAHSLDGEIEQLARGRVDPMCVLENHYRRLLARQTFELPDQRL